MVATVNWDEVREAYITGSESLRQIARRFGIAERQVMERSRTEKWVAQRQQFRSKTAAEARQRAADEAADAAALTFRVAKVILEKFLRALEEGGVELTPGHAAQWAKILLALEQAGGGGGQQIVVRWVTEPDESDG